MQRNSALLGIASSTLLVAIIVIILVVFDWHLKVIHLLEWLNAWGALASLLFILVMALAVVLLLPGIFSPPVLVLYSAWSKDLCTWSSAPPWGR